MQTGKRASREVCSGAIHHSLNAAALRRFPLSVHLPRLLVCARIPFRSFEKFSFVESLYRFRKNNNSVDDSLIARGEENFNSRNNNAFRSNYYLFIFSPRAAAMDDTALFLKK